MLCTVYMNHFLYLSCRAHDCIFHVCVRTYIPSYFFLNPLCTQMNNDDYPCRPRSVPLSLFFNNIADNNPFFLLYLGEIYIICIPRASLFLSPVYVDSKNPWKRTVLFILHPVCARKHATYLTILSVKGCKCLLFFE
jgi:hypothetical protein